MKKSSKETLANIYSSSFLFSMIAIVVVAGLEIFMLIYSFLNPGLYGSYLGVYRTFYAALFSAAVIYIVLNIFVKKDIGQHYVWLNIVNPIYVLFFFGWALGITFYDAVVTGIVDTTAFMTFSLVIPLAFMCC